MRSLVWTILALAAVGASTGCGGGGDDDGAGGGSGESSAISFDESNALAASSGSVVAMAVAAELGGLIGSAIGTLADTPPPASSSSFATKADIDLSCPAGGTARLSYNQVAVGQQATIAFTGCVGSVFSGQAIDGTIEIEIEAITGSIIGAFPSEGTATVNLTAGSDITITGSFKVLASLSGVLVDLSLGNQLGTDILTITRNTPSGAQTIEFACFKIRQVISVLTGTIDGAFEPVGVARINGSQVFSLNDYSSTPPSLTITKGVATSGSANMSSGDVSASVTFINLPYCIPFGETPSGDNSFVANEFRGEACVEVTGQDSAGNPIDYETTWGKLLNADFTPGGATCDTTTNATPGPETCDLQGTDRLPIADTYITGTGPEPDRMLADTNFGTNSLLLTRSVPNLGYTRKTYLVFDLSDLSTNVQSATLVLTLQRHVVIEGFVSGPQPFNVYGITDDDDWDPVTLPEDQITWNNAPRNVNSSVVLFEQSPGVPLLIAGYDFMLGGAYDQDDDGIDDPGTRYAFDLTDYINERIENDADGKITILIAHNNPTGANVNTSVFFSKENDEECDRPFLRLAESSVMPPTEPPTHSPNPLENQFVMATTPSAPGSTLEAWISRDGLQ